MDLMLPGVTLWWAMACLLALILDHILQPEVPASGDATQMGSISWGRQVAFFWVRTVG